MSEIKVNKLSPRTNCGTVQLGDSGDTITIPAGATISNQGTAAGFGPTGAVSWNTTKITADPNPAVTGVGYFADTTSAAFTITLPSSPSAGAVVGIADYANTFATNNLTVDRNGSNIGGVAVDATLSTDGVSITFVYVDATQGWIVTDSGNRSDLPTAQYVTATGGTETTSPCGDFKIHTFTGPGTFCVSCAGNPIGSNTVESLVVGAGGGGGSNTGGGGGSGKVTQTPSSPVTATAYTITIGAGGAADPIPITPAPSRNGSASSFGPIVSATFGNGGGSEPANNAPGGASGQPFAGGCRGNMPAGPGSGGGGGGAGAPGSPGNPFPGVGGSGGIGLSIPVSLSPPSYGTPGPAPGRYFGGGGGGGNYGSHPSGGIGGSGGGGNGGNGPGGSSSVAGTVNTGGGGGGGSCANGLSKGGGSGIVIIRYKFQ
jgi:hypothetical protein